MPDRVKAEVALYVGAVVAGVEAAAALITLPKAVHVAVAVIVAVVGALGIRQNVSPTE